MESTLKERWRELTRDVLWWALASSEGGERRPSAMVHAEEWQFSLR